MRHLRARLSRWRQDPLAANSLILFISESSSSVLMMITGLLTARLLGVADFGTFNAALAFAAVVAVVVDSGMGMVAAKDIARGGAADRRQLDEIFVWRVCVLLIACVAAPLAAWVVLPPGETRVIATWLTPGVLLMGITDFFCWIFKGARRARWCAGLQISSRLMLLSLCLWALTHPRPIPALITAYAISGGAMTLIGIVLLARAMHTLRWVRLSSAFFRATLPAIYKMGVILILSVAFTRVDLMIVARVSGSVEAGFFGAAGRVIDALRLMPMVVYSVYMPVFSSLHNNPEALRARFRDAHELLLLLSVAIALTGSVFAGPLFHVVLGPAYAGAAVCFRPLVWSCVLMFSNILMFSLLYALNDHRTPILAIVGAILLETVLNFLWVPRWGAVGAAWARLVAECFNGGTLAWGLLKTGALSFTSFLPFGFSREQKEAVS